MLVLEVSVPEVFVPEVSVPEESVPGVSVPDVSVPEGSVPEVSGPVSWLTPLRLTLLAPGQGQSVSSQALPIMPPVPFFVADNMWWYSILDNADSCKWYGFELYHVLDTVPFA